VRAFSLCLNILVACLFTPMWACGTLGRVFRFELALSQFRRAHPKCLHVMGVCHAVMWVCAHVTCSFADPCAHTFCCLFPPCKWGTLLVFPPAPKAWLAPLTIQLAFSRELHVRIALKIGLFLLYHQPL
jgi:hypothetical protein